MLILLNATDLNAESPVNKYMPKYVPRDEAFEDLKIAAMTEGKWKLKAWLIGAFSLLYMGNVN